LGTDRGCFTTLEHFNLAVAVICHPESSEHAFHSAGLESEGFFLALQQATFPLSKRSNAYPLLSKTLIASYAASRFTGPTWGIAS
jgi:hypothetical protein